MLIHFYYSKNYVAIMLLTRFYVCLECRMRPMSKRLETSWTRFRGFILKLESVKIVCIRCCQLTSLNLVSWAQQALTGFAKSQGNPIECLNDWIGFDARLSIMIGSLKHVCGGCTIALHETDNYWYIKLDHGNCWGHPNERPCTVNMLYSLILLLSWLLKRQSWIRTMDSGELQFTHYSCCVANRKSKFHLKWRIREICEKFLFIINLII